MVITDADLYPRIAGIQKDLPHLKKIIIVEHGAETLPEAADIVYYDQAMAEASDQFETAHMQKDDYSYMLYTSGTTGKPKGVVHTHNDILQAIVSTKYVLDIQADDVYWCTADLGWVTGVVYGVLGIWGLGGTSVIYEGRFSPENWYKVLQDYKVTVWYSAPTAIRMLMGAPVQPQDFDLSALRHLCSVGEPLNPEAIWWGLDALGLPFHDTWWQTELGAISITNYPALDIKPGSMGKPLPGIEVAVIDHDGQPLPAGSHGDLALKTSTISSLMKTIWNNDDKFKSYFKGDWYISGDAAYHDEDGYFWFIGRVDDVIMTAGERVGPFEVESSLVECPEVIEAGVIGKPDAVRGEIIKAFVVVKPGVTADDELKEKLQQHVKKHLAGHAYPREIAFIDKLPKTRSGKIMRRVLKAQELGLPVGDTSTLENY
jgi:acetyl-CoA synthetase